MRVRGRCELGAGGVAAEVALGRRAVRKVVVGVGAEQIDLVEDVGAVEVGVAVEALVDAIDYKSSAGQSGLKLLGIVAILKHIPLVGLLGGDLVRAVVVGRVAQRVERVSSQLPYFHFI